MGLHRVLDPLHDNVIGEGDERDLGGWDLPLLEVAQVLGEPARGLQHRAAQGPRHDGEVPRGLACLDLAADAAVEPASVDQLVANEVVTLHHVDRIVDDRADLPADRHVLERHDHVVDGLPPVVALGEDVPELRVGVLVDAAVRLDGEVPPHVGGGSEAQLFDNPARGLESVVRVLRGDAHGHHVPAGGGGDRLDEVNLVCAVHVLPVEAADVGHAVQGNAHGDHKLARGEVDIGDPLRHRVLDLEARVELEEVEALALDPVEVLHGSRAHVPDVLGELDGSELHLAEGLGAGSGARALLDDLLVAALDGAVAGVHRADVAVLVRQQLHLQVAGLGRELHREDGGPGHLPAHLREERLDVLLALHHADALPAPAPGRLEHDGVPDLPAGLLGLGRVVDARAGVHFRRDLAVAFRIGEADPRAAPRERGHARSLREDGGANLVAEGGHRLRGRAEERDPLCREGGGEVRVL
mmetsp:Transcript_29724/g.95550  ORF Transcript_29724/g.95550 Transcript_29724/m.95550 type:complete len:470 (+) Transcript_29724:1674-3083(+)